MRYRTLGNTDIEVSEVALGCWALIGGFNWGDQDRDESVAAIHASFDAGVTFFDTAPAYGDGASESLVGEALAGRRDKVVIATKVGKPLHPDRIASECEGSLQRLSTDYVDLYQLHWPDWSVPFEDSGGALERLKEAGKIRAWGVSNFGPRDIRDMVRLGTVVSNQLPYSLLWRMVEYDVQEQCVEHNVSILCYSPLMQGLLAGTFRSADEVPVDRARTRHFSRKRAKTRHDEEGCEEETFAAVASVRSLCEQRDMAMGDVALAWLLRQPAVTSVLSGARNARQAERNARASDLDLDDDLVEALSAATEVVKRALGENLDPWMSDSRVR